MNASFVLSAVFNFLSLETYLETLKLEVKTWNYAILNVYVFQLLYVGKKNFCFS